MRKLFTEPTMEIKRFAAENIVTASGDAPVNGTPTGTDKVYSEAGANVITVDAVNLGFVF